MKLLAATVAIGALHMHVTLMLWFYLAGAAMSSFDTMTPPSPTEKIVAPIAYVLAFPFVWPTSDLTTYFSGRLDFVPYALNGLAQSFLFCTTTRFFYRRVRVSTK